MLTGYQCVPLEELVVALLQEDVGFVEDQDGAPCDGVVKDLSEALLEHGGVGPDLAAGDLVQGFAKAFGNALGREGLAGSWRAVEECDEAGAFARDQVIDSGCLVDIRGHHRLDDLLVFFIQNESFPRVLAEIHRPKLRYIEIFCLMSALILLSCHCPLMSTYSTPCPSSNTRGPSADKVA